MKSLKLENFGPIQSADIKLHDLTVCVGHQATGKSLFWQMFKLAMDTRPVLDEMKKYNIDWNDDPGIFQDLYFGEGMRSLIGPNTSVQAGKDTLDLSALLHKRPRKTGETVFYIPAQRVMAVRDGATRTFTEYRASDPFVIREFSQRLHQLVQTEFVSAKSLFPASNRMSERLRRIVDEAFFRGFELKLSKEKYQKKLVLSRGDTELPFLAWSAGQREFAPLLLGLYWLMPSGATARRNDIQWAVIEEPEMGLHPKAISAFMVLVLELLRRGYKVCLSTHSQHVLDVVWGLRTIIEGQGHRDDVLRMLDMGKTAKTKAIADAAMQKSTGVYYFSPSGPVRDISSLDPGAEDDVVSGWGGLTEFSGRIGDVIADVVSRTASQKSGGRE